MTPKEKALELIDKLYIHSKTWDCFNDVPLKEPHAVKCALIAVDEILKLPSLDDGRMISITEFDYNYWQEVKKELEAMK